MKNSLVPMVIVQEGHGERSYDIFSRLLKERIIMVSEDVNDTMSSVIVSSLLYLQSEDPEAPIHMYINSPGGVCTAGLAIYDTMKLVSNPIYTYCMGQCCSMGSVLLSGGDKGKRFILPNARVMVHQASGGCEGKMVDMEISLKEGLRINQVLTKILAENCGKTEEEMKKYMDRDYFMDAEQSIAFGIVDKILESKK